MTRERKMAKAQKWRDEGMRYQRIAERLGVSTTTVYRWLNPERVAPYRNGRACDPARTREVDREYEQRHRKECGRCGGDRPRQFKGELCQSCIEDDVDRRSRQIEAEWKAGRSMAAIAGAHGFTPNHFRREVRRLREKGYALPYRYQHHKHAPRFPEQVAA